MAKDTENSDYNENSGDRIDSTGDADNTDDTDSVDAADADDSTDVQKRLSQKVADAFAKAKELKNSNVDKIGRAKESVKESSRESAEQAKRKAAEGAEKTVSAINAAGEKSIQGINRAGTATARGIGKAAKGSARNVAGAIAGGAAAAGTGYTIGKKAGRATVDAAKAIDATVDVRTIAEGGKRITFWTFEKIIGIFALIVVIILLAFAFAIISGAWKSGRIAQSYNSFKVKVHEVNPFGFVSSAYERLFKEATGEYYEGKVEDTKEFVGIEITDPFVQNKLSYGKDEAKDVEVSARLNSYNSRSVTSVITIGCYAKDDKKWIAQPANISSITRITTDLTCYAPRDGAPEGQYLVKFVAVAHDFETSSRLTVNLVEAHVLGEKIESYARSKGFYIKDDSDYAAALKDIYPSAQDPVSVSDKGPIKLIISVGRQPVIGVGVGDKVKLVTAFENMAYGAVKNVNSLTVRLPDGLEPGTDADSSCRTYTYDKPTRTLKLKKEYIANANFSNVQRFSQVAFPSCSLTVKSLDDLKKLLEFPNLPNPRDFIAQISYDYQAQKEFSIRVGNEVRIDYAGIGTDISANYNLKCEGYAPDKNNIPGTTLRQRFENYRSAIFAQAQSNLPHGLDTASYAALLATVAQKESSFVNKCESFGRSALTGCGWPGSDCSTGCTNTQHCQSDGAQIKCTAELLKNRYENPSGSYSICNSYSGQQRWECIFDVYNSGGYPNKHGSNYGQDTLSHWQKWRNYLCT